MTAKKKTPPAPPQITVADAILALASYPQDAVLMVTDPYINVGVEVSYDDMHPEYFEVLDWQNGDANHYRPIAARIVQCNAPGDDFATAQEVLAWLAANDIVLRHPGHGHNELDGPVRKSAAELAEEFARREP